MQDRLWFAGQAKRHMDTVFRVAYNYLRNCADADDVTQTVLFKLFRSDVEFNDEAHVKRWLIRATINECTSLYRALRRRPENIDDYLETLAAPECDCTHDIELLRRSWTCHRVTACRSTCITTRGTTCMRWRSCWECPRRLCARGWHELAVGSRMR